MTTFPKLGCKCPNLAGINFRGEVTLEDYLGKWVILCTYSSVGKHPSYLKFNHLMRSKNTFLSKDIEVVGIADDEAHFSTICILDPNQITRAILHDSATSSITLPNLIHMIDEFRAVVHSVANDPTYNPLCPTINRIVGEYILGNPQNVDPELLDFVTYAFALIQPDGSLQVYSERYLRQLVNLKTYKPSLKVILAIGGWGAEGFSDAALTPTSRYNFAREVNSWLNRYNLDGVDIDWEYPGSSVAGIKSRPEDKENFTLLLTALRDVLGPDKWITVAGSGDMGYINNVEIDKIAPIINYFNLMSYDFTAGSTGADAAKHHANLYPSNLALSNYSVDAYVNNLKNAGMPASKIMVGLPFYGRYGANLTKTYDEIRASYLNKNGYSVKWDDVAKAPYITDPNGNFFLSFDNPVSIYYKGEYVIKNCLAGLFSWQSSLDQANILASAMSSAIDDPNALKDLLMTDYSWEF